MSAQSVTPQERNARWLFATAVVALALGYYFRKWIEPAPKAAAVIPVAQASDPLRSSSLTDAGVSSGIVMPNGDLYVFGEMDSSIWLIRGTEGVRVVEVTALSTPPGPADHAAAQRENDRLRGEKLKRDVEEQAYRIR